MDGFEAKDRGDHENEEIFTMIDRQSVMRKLYWVVVATAVLIILFHLGKAYGSERHGVTNPTPPAEQPARKHKDKSFVVPIVIIGIGAGIWCIFKCDEQPKPEPLPSPGPTPLTITPSNLKDSTYIIEAR